MIGPADVLGGISEHDRYNAVLERLLQDDLRQARIAVPTPDWETAAAVPVNYDLLARPESDPAKLAATAIAKIVVPIMREQTQKPLLETIDYICGHLVGRQPSNYGAYDLVSRVATVVRQYPDPLEAENLLEEIKEQETNDQKSAPDTVWIDQALSNIYGNRYTMLQIQHHNVANHVFVADI